MERDKKIESCGVGVELSSSRNLWLSRALS